MDWINWGFSYQWALSAHICSRGGNIHPMYTQYWPHAEKLIQIPIFSEIFIAILRDKSPALKEMSVLSTSLLFLFVLCIGARDCVPVMMHVTIVLPICNVQCTLYPTYQHATPHTDNFCHQSWNALRVFKSIPWTLCTSQPLKLNVSHLGPSKVWQSNWVTNEEQQLSHKCRRRKKCALYLSALCGIGIFIDCNAANIELAIGCLIVGLGGWHGLIPALIADLVS